MPSPTVKRIAKGTFLGHIALLIDFLFNKT